MSIHRFWNRFNQSLGFDQDERQCIAQSRAARNAYFTTLSAAALAAVYQLVTGWLSAPLWPVGLSMALSLAVVAAYRIRLVGFAARDERLLRLKPPLYFWGYLTLTIGLFVYGSVLFWGFDDVPAMMLWTLCYILALPVLWLSHVRQNTVPGRPWLWLLVAVAVLGSLAPGLWWLVASVLHDLRRGEPLPSLREFIPIMFYLAPPLLFGGMAVLAAWRTWRAERDADG
jgi:hypothetical protein